ncbi:hypothetical protein ACFE04_023176 [Oxalis oulophora]
MDYHNISKASDTISSKLNKKKLTKEQVRLLERTFSTNKKLEPELKLELSNQLGVLPRQVAIWYQNKRARWKTQNLELDYNTLQVKLECATADKKRLEKEVKQLRGELLRAHQDLSFLASTDAGGNDCYYPDPMYNFPPSSGSCYSTSCSEDNGGGGGGGNSRGDDSRISHLHQELYDCLIGGDGSTWG